MCKLFATSKLHALHVLPTVFQRICFTWINVLRDVSPSLGTNARFIITRRPHLATVRFIPLTCPYEIIHASRRHIVPRGSRRISGERCEEGSRSSPI